MVQTFTALLNEFRNHRIGTRGLEQLNARPSGGQHDDVDLFLFHGFARAHGKSKLLVIEPERVVERSHGDTQVINFEFVWSSHRLWCTDHTAGMLLVPRQPENQCSQIVRAAVRAASREAAAPSWQPRDPSRPRGQET